MGLLNSGPYANFDPKKDPYLQRFAGQKGPGRGIPLQQETPQGLLDQMALSTMAIPVIGDVVGAASDVGNIIADPSPANIGMGLLGAMPFIPSVGAIRRVGGGGTRLFHGSSTPDIERFDPSLSGSVQTSDWGEGVYLTPSKSTASYYAREAAQRTSDVKGDAMFDAMESTAKEFGTTGMNKWLDLRSGKITQAQYDALNKMEQSWRDHRRSFRANNNGSVYEVIADIKKPKYYQYEGITDPYLAERAAAQGHDAVFIHHAPEQGQDINDTIEEILVMNPDLLSILSVE